MSLLERGVGCEVRKMYKEQGSAVGVRVCKAAWLLCSLAVMLSCSCQASEWFWHWTGTCDPVCTGTLEGSWSWSRRDGSNQPGSECYFEIVDNGAAGKAIRIVDNSWEGGTPSGSRYMCWYPFCRGNDLPPNCAPAVQSGRPDAAGGTITIRFKVDSYQPGLTDPLAKRNMIMLRYGFPDPASADPQDPDVKHVGITLRSGWPGPWDAGQPITPDCWGIINDVDALVWNEAEQAWEARPPTWLENPGTGTTDFCDGQWHTLWISAAADTFPPGMPDYTHCRCWVDGILVDEWWAGGSSYETGCVGFEHSKEKIDASIDYCCFAYEPLPVDGLPIPDDTSSNFAGHRVGPAKLSPDTTLVGDPSQPYLAGKYVNAVLEPVHIQEKPVYYVEEDGRESGVLVQPNGNVVDQTGAPTQVSPGDRIDIYGAVMSPLGEKAIGAWKIVKCDPPLAAETCACEPLGVTNASVAGSFEGNSLDNTGLLVTLWGRVTAVDYARGFFWVDDGFGFVDGSGATSASGSPASGVMVTGFPLPDENTYVTLRGVVGRFRYFVPERSVDVAVPVVYMVSLSAQ